MAHFDDLPAELRLLIYDYVLAETQWYCNGKPSKRIRQFYYHLRQPIFRTNNRIRGELLALVGSTVYHSTVYQSKDDYVFWSDHSSMTKRGCTILPQRLALEVNLSRQQDHRPSMGSAIWEVAQVPGLRTLEFLIADVCRLDRSNPASRATLAIIIFSQWERDVSVFLLPAASCSGIETIKISLARLNASDFSEDGYKRLQAWVEGFNARMAAKIAERQTRWTQSASSLS